MLPVATAKQVGVVEQVIQVVELHALAVACRQGPFLLVTLEKGRWKSAEEAGHGQIHFAITAIHSRIKHGASAALQQASIAAPQIPVHQAGPWLMVGQPVGHALQQGLRLGHGMARLRCQLQLHP